MKLYRKPVSVTDGGTVIARNAAKFVSHPRGPKANRPAQGGPSTAARFGQLPAASPPSLRPAGCEPHQPTAPLSAYYTNR